MKKIILSVTKKKQIADKRLTTFEEDFKETIYPKLSNGSYKLAGKVINQDGKTGTVLSWLGDGCTSPGEMQFHTCKYQMGEIYKLDEYKKIKIELVELLQRENIFYWKYTVSLVE